MLSLTKTGLLSILISIAFAAAGCTHVALRNNTVNQMRTVHDIQQQQVLDNMAMFVCDPDAFPFYSIATQGTASIQDSGNLSITTGFGASAPGKLFLNSLSITPAVSRSAQELWTLTPVNDSVKLSLMRCAYQRSMAGCIGRGASCDCPNCNAVLGSFYPVPQQAPLPLSPAMNPVGDILVPTGMQSALGTVPVVVKVTSFEDPGTYNPGNTIHILVTFNQSVWVAGSPTIQLNAGKSAAAKFEPKSPNNGNGTDTLTFEYKVGGDDNSDQLNYVSKDALTLNGGTIKNGYGTDALLILPDPESLGARNLVVKATKPSLGQAIQGTWNQLSAMVAKGGGNGGGSGSAGKGGGASGGGGSGSGGGGSGGGGGALGGGAPQGLPHVPGTLTPYCLSTDKCWFCWGPKKMVPKDCDCAYIGHYNNMYVWVPQSGRNELTKLTLLVQDIAFYQPPDAPTQPSVSITIGSNSSDSSKGSDSPGSDPKTGSKPTTGDSGKGKAPGGTSQSTPVQLQASVPLGTNPDAVLFAHKVTELDTILARHNMNEQQLVDYWSRGVAGPGMTPEDTSNISRLLALLCRSPDWTYMPTPPSRSDVEFLLFGGDLPETTTNKPELISQRLCNLAQVWSQGRYDEDGLDPNPAVKLAVLDFYRMDSNCNPLARMGIDVLDKIAYTFLRQMPEVPLTATTLPDTSGEVRPSGSSTDRFKSVPLTWSAVRQRLAELQVPSAPPARMPSPVPYGGLLGTAVLLQSVTPPPIAPAAAPVR